MTTLAEALAPRSDQLNADDLIPGPRVLKFTGVRVIKDGRDIKLVLNFEGDNGKPWKPCKSMGRAMVMAWGITDENITQMIGKSVRVFRDPEVSFGDQKQIGGIRISHMSHITKPAQIKLTVSQGKKAMFTFHPLVTDAETKADAAAEWAAKHISELGQMDDLDALDKHIAAGAKAVERLKANRLELHDKVIAAYDLRREMLTPIEGEGFAHPATGEDDF